MNILKTEAEKFGIYLDSNQLEKFKIYLDYLLEYNSHTNLTAITSHEDVIIKHFLDSIVVKKYIPDNSKVIDVGTGAGFPGMPIKICDETVDLTLLDSLNKRVKFLNELSLKLDVKAEIYHSRAEELSLNPKFREQFDVAVSRAVAPLNVLVEYCLPYVRKGGCLIALKGPDLVGEVKHAKNAIQILGGKVEEQISFDLPFEKGKRTLLIIRKHHQTPKNYPRKNSKISSSPL